MSNKQGIGHEVAESSLNTVELEKKLALLALNSDEPFVMVGKDLRIITLNSKFEDLYFNYFQKHVVKGASILDYARTENVHHLKKIYERAFSGETIISELEAQSPTNEIHSFNIKYKAAYDEYGHIIGAFVTAMDTCAIKNSQKQLVQSEKRYRALTENGRYALAILTENGKTNYVSPSVEKLLGYGEQELLNLDLLSLIHHEDRSIISNTFKEVLLTPGYSAIANKLRVQKKDGTGRWYEFIITNHTRDPFINGITCIFSDITEKVEAERQKEFDHHNLSALINNTKDLMWSISTEGKLISSNLAFDQMVKWMSGFEVEKGGDAPFKGFPEQNIQRWKKYYERAFTGEIFTITEHTDFPEEHWSEISFYPILDGKTVIGTACYSRNITERKRVERQFEHQTKQLLSIKSKLEHSELRLKQAQSIAKVGSWEVNLLNNTSTWSDQAYQIYGLEPGDHNLSYDEWHSYIHPEDVKAFQMEMARHRRELNGSRFQHRIVLRSGTVKHVVSESRYELNQTGVPISLYGVVHDITDRVNAEKQLFKSHTLLKKLTDNVPLAIYQFEVDTVGRMTFPFMSEAILQLVPNADLELIKTDATSVFSSIHPEDLPLLISTIETSRKNLSTWDLEFRTLVGSEQKWLNGFSKPYRKNNGSTVWYGYLQDITEKKQYLDEIQKTKERYDLIAKATNDALYDWDLVNNRVYRSGDGLSVLFGYDDPIEIGQENFWQKNIHPDEEKTCYQKLIEVLNDPSQTICNQEYRFKKADGTYAHVFDKGIVIRNEQGRAVRMIGATQDISKLKQSETLLKELNEALEKRAKELALSNAELEQFAYLASHDLQEPLRMVTSFLTQLENKYKDRLDEKANQYIHFATDGAARMRRLILDLLEYSRVGKQVTRMRYIDANILAKECVAMNKSVIDECGAMVQWENLPVVYACETRLSQVFQNLIGNAMKYHKRGVQPNVTISATETDTHWQFSVADNGIGIEEKYFQKVFVVFQRLHNKDEYSGTGIGLAICKKIIEGHRGNIWIDSRYGEGSTFHFTIAKPDHNNAA